MFNKDNLLIKIIVTIIIITIILFGIILYFSLEKEEPDLSPLDITEFIYPEDYLPEELYYLSGEIKSFNENNIIINASTFQLKGNMLTETKEIKSATITRRTKIMGNFLVESSEGQIKYKTQEINFSEIKEGMSVNIKVDKDIYKNNNLIAEVITVFF